MPAPLVLVGVAAAAVAALVFGGKKKNGNGNGKKKGPLEPIDKPAVDKAGALCEYEADITPGLKASVDHALRMTANTVAERTALAASIDATAAVVDQAGFPRTAECLRKRASDLRTEAAVETAAKGGMPFRIRSGDIPVNLANWYTGDPSFAKIQELVTFNSAVLGPWVTKNGIQQPQNWFPGIEILIPLSWNPLAKPLPPVAGKPQIPSTGGLGSVNPDPLVAQIQDWINSNGGQPPVSGNA